jgi:hypothetical protein
MIQLRPGGIRPQPLPPGGIGLGAAAALITVLGCSSDAGGRRPGEPVQWPVSTQPTLELGVVEGDSMYQFFSAKSAVRFGDGSVVMANTGTGELRRFDAQGRFDWRAGGRGGGPGEFGSLVRIYPHRGDSILAFDDARRMSVFDPQGTFARSYQMAYDPENLFPLDSWLYLKNWVEGPFDSAARAPLKRALERLPPLPAEQTYRFVRVDDVGLLWSRDPIGPNSSTRHWTVYDSTGAILARADTPLRFDVYQIGEDFILGRWRNEEDVEFIRTYGLTRTPATPIPVGLDEETDADVLEEIDTEEFLPRFRSALRQLVTAQELNYMNNRTYTDNVADLQLEVDDVTLDIVWADARGWVAVGSHPQFPLICAMAIGFAVPPGWAEGMTLCAEGRK